MRMINNLIVMATARDVRAFNALWPCSRLDSRRAYCFEFTGPGDLVDCNVPEKHDGPEASALADDCRAFWIVSHALRDGLLEIRDNGGKTFDRFTAVYLDRPDGRGLYDARAMSENPFHPQGFGQYTAAMPGRHLGRQVRPGRLPRDVIRCIAADRDND